MVMEALPDFYGNLLQLYRHYDGRSTKLVTSVDVLVQSLFGNQAVLDLNDRPFYSNLMVLAENTTIGDIYDDHQWIEAT